MEMSQCLKWMFPSHLPFKPLNTLIVNSGTKMASQSFPNSGMITEPVSGLDWHFLNSFEVDHRKECTCDTYRGCNQVFYPFSEVLFNIHGQIKGH